MPSEPIKTQRFLTVDFLAKRRITAPAVWLKPETGIASTEDAARAPEKLETNLADWNSPDEENNAAIRLVDGYIELRIKSPDDVWIRNFFDACAALRVDARAAYGGRTISSIILKIEDPTSIDSWRARWPRGHFDRAHGWVETEFAYSLTIAKKMLWRDSSPLPGSRFGGQLIRWRPLGKPAADDIELGLEDLERRPIGSTTMESVIRAIAFATLAYWIRIYLDGLTQWDEILIRAIGGWIARLIREGRDINARGKSLENVCWSPIDAASNARELIAFLARFGAPKALEHVFVSADRALDYNSAAPISGWTAIERLFGSHAKVGIRRAFRAGLDIDAIERMSERYAYDQSDHVYLDREALLKGLRYEHKYDDLIKQWDNEPVFLQTKPHNPFKLYATSQLRTDVQRRDFYPGAVPGAVLRHSPVHGLLNGEDRHADEYRLLNTFPGFSIRPIGTVDPAVMGEATSMLDRMLGLLTRDNDDQMLWLKKFVAWIAQRPEIKPQVCPIIVGGQGIGKSIFGEKLMSALFSGMAGSADSASLVENKFLITPFLGKLITFIDEVRLESIGSINTIKKLVRSDFVSGQVKFGHQRDYYIPSRLICATNQANIGLSPEDAADRAFFFIVSWTAENKHMSDREFLNWSLELKPFYSKFVTALETVAVKQHLMRYFSEIEVNREELEDLRFSSRDDENVVRATMSKARDVARRIIADARVMQNLDITAWFGRVHLREAIRRQEGPRTKLEEGQVLMEFERAGLIEKKDTGDMYKFKWGYGKLLQKVGEAHALPLAGIWSTKPGIDWEDNDLSPWESGPEWRGAKQMRQKEKPYVARREYDPDEMEPE
jgi:hypothetical protein